MSILGRQCRAIWEKPSIVLVHQGLVLAECPCVASWARAQACVAAHLVPLAVATVAGYGEAAVSEHSNVRCSLFRHPLQQAVVEQVVRGDPVVGVLQDAALEVLLHHLANRLHKCQH